MMADNNLHPLKKILTNPKKRTVIMTSQKKNTKDKAPKLGALSSLLLISKFVSLPDVFEFDFDKLESAGVSDADALEAFSNAVVRPPKMVVKKEFSLEDVIADSQPGGPSYRAMRAWQKVFRSMENEAENRK
jgi:hypothetical protein